MEHLDFEVRFAEDENEGLAGANFGNAGNV